MCIETYAKYKQGSNATRGLAVYAIYINKKEKELTVNLVKRHTKKKMLYLYVHCIYDGY